MFLINFTIFKYNVFSIVLTLFVTTACIKVIHWVGHYFRGATKEFYFYFNGRNKTDCLRLFNSFSTLKTILLLWKSDTTSFEVRREMSVFRLLRLRYLEILRCIIVMTPIQFSNTLGNLSKGRGLH